MCLTFPTDICHPFHGAIVPPSPSPSVPYCVVMWLSSGIIWDCVPDPKQVLCSQTKSCWSSPFPFESEFVTRRDLPSQVWQSVAPEPFVWGSQKLWFREGLDGPRNAQHGKQPVESGTHRSTGRRDVFTTTFPTWRSGMSTEWGSTKFAACACGYGCRFDFAY